MQCEACTEPATIHFTEVSAGKPRHHQLGQPRAHRRDRPQTANAVTDL